MSWSFTQKFPGREAFEGIVKVVHDQASYKDNDAGRKALDNICSLLQMVARDHHDKETVTLGSYGHVDSNGGGSFTVTVSISSQKGEWAMTEEEAKAALKLMRETPDVPAPTQPVVTPPAGT